MLLEAKFTDKSLIILRISDEIPGLMHERFFAVCWAPAVLPTKIKAANSSPHTCLKVMLWNLSWTAQKKWLFFDVRSFLHPFHRTGTCYCVRFTVGVIQPRSSCWDSTRAFAVACWEDTCGLVCRGSKHISWCFFDVSRNVKALHSGKNSPIPKHFRWGALTKAAPVLLKMHQTGGPHCVFLFLWSTSIEATNSGYKVSCLTDLTV